MKKTIFTLLVTFTFFSLFAQVDRETVLIEVATGTWCTWCPSVAKAVDQLHENGDPVAIIEYHNGDPYANTESNARNSYYGVSGYPNSQFDGSWSNYPGGSTGDLYPTFLGKVNQRMGMQAPVTLEINGTNDGDDYSITVKVTKVDENYSGSNLYVRFALTESHIPVIWFDMDEVNFVERIMLPDATGTSIDFNSGDVVEVPLSFTFNNSWDIDNCELVAFLQDDSGKEVLHSTHVMLTDLEEGTPSFMAGFYADDTNYCATPAVAHFHSDCIGDPISWNWTFEGGMPENSYDENPVITYLDEGSYDVQLIVSDGENTDTALYEKYIYVGSPPDVSWNDVPDLCNEDWDPYLLTEGQPSGGEYSGDHVIDNMYFDSEGLDPGDYPVTYTYMDEYGCSNSADYLISVVNCVGIDENKITSLELFPNPTTGILNLNIDANHFNNADLSIIDAVGKEVYRQEGLNIDGTYSTSIDLSEQPQGIYFVIINGEKQNISKKVFLSK